MRSHLSRPSSPPPTWPPPPLHCRRWRSNPSGKCSQERLTRRTVTSTMRRAAHPSGCARCGAGAGCSAIRYQSLSAPDAAHSPPKVLRGGIPKSIFHRRCQYLAINAHEMAPRTGRWLQERGRDTPT
jgi:hypothetical protein